MGSLESVKSGVAESRCIWFALQPAALAEAETIIRYGQKKRNSTGQVPNSGDSCPEKRVVLSMRQRQFMH